MNLYIPSSGRAAEQYTLRQLSPEWREKTIIVVPEAELDEYHKWNGDIKIMGCPHRGIGPTRQFIIHAAYPGKVVMMDDDLRFFCRRTDNRTKFCDAYEADVDKMLKEIEHQLQFYAAVGVCPREGGNRYPDRYYDNVRLLRVLAYDTTVLATHDIDFRTVPVMEDFLVSLSLLTRGYGNVMLSDWCHNQRGSNDRGGCSQYRTMDMQRDAALMLKQYFPDFVTVVTKNTKTAWGGQERTDVKIQWKKAFASSTRENGPLDKQQMDDTRQAPNGSEPSLDK